MAPRAWLAIGAVAAGLGVLAGAFGAHALRSRLGDANLAVFETGARYQMYHALGLLAVGLVTARAPSAAAHAAGWFFLTGIVVFSGSLYLLSLTGQRGWGAVTPLGGVAFLIGWGCLAWAAAVGRWGGGVVGP